MSDEEAIDFSVELNVDGKTVKMTEISVYDRAAILKKMKLAMKAETRQNAKDAGLDADQVFTELAEFDKRAKEFGDNEFVEYIMTDEGKVDVFEAALRPNVGDDSPAIAKRVKFKNDEFLVLCGLCNLRIKQPSEAPPANPPEGVDQTTAKTSP
jgi:hypothetical protein